MKLIFPAILFSWLVTACASTEYMLPNHLYIKSDHFRTLREPSLYEIAQKNADAEQYRLTVLSSRTPIHSLRVKIHDDRTGTTTVKVANKGYLVRGKNSLKSRKVRKASFQDTSELGNIFSTLDFQNIYPDQNQVVSIHPTLLCYESARNGQYHIVCDSTGNITKITQTLLPVFYRLGGVNANSDWSLYEWFGLDELE